MACMKETQSQEATGAHSLQSARGDNKSRRQDKTGKPEEAVHSPTIGRRRQDKS
jgi:hypothetical protein